MNNISFKEKVAYAEQQLQNGVDPRFVFSQVWKFSDGFATVRLEDKYNFINTNGELLSDLWFDEAWSFREGFAVVYLRDRGWNFINADSNFLREDLWFDNVGEFHEGLASVYLKDRGCNFINADGNFLRKDMWFDWVDYFQEGFAEVKLNGKSYYIDTKGKLYDQYKNLIENRQRTIRLTESQLRNTIKRVVAQCLKEGRIR